MKETILITGATGFLGSHLVHALISANYNVIALKRSSSDCWRISDVMDKVKFYDINEMEKAFYDQKINVVIHTACSYGKKNESLHQIIDTNVVLGIRLLEYLVLYKVDTFINTDTFFPKYLNSYSLSKKQFVEWFKFYSKQLRIVNLRLQHMYGEKDDVSKFIPWLVNQLKSNVPEIKLTKGAQIKDFVYVSDVVSAYLLLLQKREELEDYSEFDVGSGEQVSVHDFVESLYVSYKEIHQNVSTKLLFGAVPYREGELMEVRENIEPLEKLGWNPSINYKDGIRLLLG